MNTKNVQRLKGYLEEYYINDPSQESPDMSGAIRDMLTDLMHLGDEEGINIQSRLLDAEEVYEIELNNELSAKTGVTDPC